MCLLEMSLGEGKLNPVKLSISLIIVPFTFESSGESMCMLKQPRYFFSPLYRRSTSALFQLLFQINSGKVKWPILTSC